MNILLNNRKTLTKNTSIQSWCSITIQRNIMNWVKKNNKKNKSFAKFYLKQVNAELTKLFLSDWNVNVSNYTKVFFPFRSKELYLF